MRVWSQIRINLEIETHSCSYYRLQHGLYSGCQARRLLHANMSQHALVSLICQLDMAIHPNPICDMTSDMAIHAMLICHFKYDMEIYPNCVCDADMAIHPNANAPRCLPCNYKDELVGQLPPGSFDAPVVSSLLT